MDLLQPVRGTADLLPEEKARHNHVVSVAHDVARCFGFQDMATPVFEFTHVFSRPLGASSDVVSKETYSFEDRGGAGLTLRPEGQLQLCGRHIKRVNAVTAFTLVLRRSNVSL